MKTLVFGAGPIGRWLTLRLARSGADVTLLARERAKRELSETGIEITDGLTGERHLAHVPVVSRVDPAEGYDLVVVAIQKAFRRDVCPALIHNPKLENILVLGNDVSGFDHYQSRRKVLLGFPGAGGGWRDGELVFMDRERPRGPRGELFLGELDGAPRARTESIARLFRSAGIQVNVEKDMDGWLKYHYAFIAPTAGVILEKGGDLKAVAADPECLHRYCRACREAGDVLRAVGFTKRQPPVFNLYYWLPRWLEPTVFSRLFGSHAAEIRFGLHARSAVPELLEMTAEFARLRRSVGLATPTLDALLAPLQSSSLLDMSSTAA